MTATDLGLGLMESDYAHFTKRLLRIALLHDPDLRILVVVRDARRTSWFNRAPRTHVENALMFGTFFLLLDTFRIGVQIPGTAMVWALDFRRFFNEVVDHSTSLGITVGTLRRLHNTVASYEVAHGLA